MIWGYPYFRKPPYPFLNPVQVPRNPGGLVFGAESKGTQGSNGRSAPRSSRLIQVAPVRVLLEGTPDFNRDLHSTSCWETTRSHIECLGTACMPRLKWSARSLHGTDRFQLESHITNYFFGGGLGWWFALLESPSKVIIRFLTLAILKVSKQEEAPSSHHRCPFPSGV